MIDNRGSVELGQNRENDAAEQAAHEVAMAYGGGSAVDYRHDKGTIAGLTTTHLFMPSKPVTGLEPATTRLYTKYHQICASYFVR